MTQTLIAFKVTDTASAHRITSELTNRGYAVGDANRMVKPAIQIRIREDTGDRAEVELVVASLDPGSSEMPAGTPSVTLKGYRAGR